MEFSIIHPSRSRPTAAIKIMTMWLNHSINKLPIEYIFSLDEDDPYLSEYREGIKTMKNHYDEVVGTCFDITIVVKPNKSSIEAINKGAEYTNGNLMIVVSDDFECPQSWDELLYNKLAGKKDYIVKTWDGIQKWLITLPIMDRMYYERFGYIYHPEYKHLFADTEMTEVGHLLGRVVDLQNELPMFKHKHYITGEVTKDAINEKNDATWNQGEELFYKRKAINFGLSV